MDVVNFDDVVFLLLDQKCSPGGEGVDREEYCDSLGVPFNPEVLRAWLAFEDDCVVKKSIDCRVVVEDRFMVRVDPEVTVVFYFNGRVVLKERLAVACSPYEVPSTCGPSKLYYWEKGVDEPLFYDRKIQRIDALQSAVMEKTIRVRGKRKSGRKSGRTCSSLSNWITWLFGSTWKS
jgi:hypothetical protein